MGCNVAEIISDMGWDEYCRLDRMNGSTLTAGFKSMLHLRNQLKKGGDRETDDMRFGHQVHCLLLEPERFEADHVVVPDFHLDPGNQTGKGGESTSRNTKYVKEKVAEFAKENAGRSFLSRDKYDQALCMIEALHSHSTAHMWLDHCQMREVTVLGEIEGVPFKGRLDLLGIPIVDLKTTSDVSPGLFGNTFARYHYGPKLAIYRELVRQATGQLKDVYLIAVETGGDFDVAVYQIPEQVLDLGMGRVVDLLKKYKACLESDRWPGVDGGEPYVDLRFPNWAMPEEEALDWSEA